MIEEEDDPKVLAALARGRLRGKRRELAEVVPGLLRDRHRFVLRQHLDRIDELSRQIEKLDKRIVAANTGPFGAALDVLESIPGVGRRAAGRRAACTRISARTIWGAMTSSEECDTWWRRSRKWASRSRCRTKLPEPWWGGVPHPFRPHADRGHPHTRDTTRPADRRRPAPEFQNLVAMADALEGNSEGSTPAGISGYLGIMSNDTIILHIRRFPVDLSKRLNVEAARQTVPMREESFPTRT